MAGDTRSDLTAMQLQLRRRVGSPFDESACLVVVKTTKGDIWWTDTTNPPRRHRFVVRFVVHRKVQHLGRQSTCTRSRPKFAHAQYKNSAVQKIKAFHAGGNTSCGRGMRNYRSTNSGLMSQSAYILSPRESPL